MEPDDDDEASRFVHSGSGAINVNEGEGSQKINHHSGSGSLYSAEQQFFGRNEGTVINCFT